MGKREQVKATKFVDKHQALLVFPLKNQKAPLSLWKCFFPRAEMRWEWDDNGNNRVATLWHLRAELSTSREVIYSKWFNNRATLFSLELFAVLLASVSSQPTERLKLSREAGKLYQTLLEDSPLGTKSLRELSGFEGKERASIFDRAMKELWNSFLIVGYGEVQEGGFPSLATAATKTIFEDIWDESGQLFPVNDANSEGVSLLEHIEQAVTRLLPASPEFKKKLMLRIQKNLMT